MPTDDHRADAPAELEIEVTPEMVEAGAEALEGYHPDDAIPGRENDRLDCAEYVLRAGLSKIDAVKLRQWALNIKE